MVRMDSIVVRIPRSLFPSCEDSLSLMSTRRNRTYAIVWLILGILFIALGVVKYGVLRKRDVFTYADVVFGVGWLWLAWIYRQRSQQT